MTDAEKAMRERFEAHVDGAKAALFADEMEELRRFSGMICEFAASEVARATQPTEPSRELAEAERCLRDDREILSREDAHIIASEMDRLRRELLAGKGDAPSDIMVMVGETLTEPDEDNQCHRCGDFYSLDDGTEPTALCHPCAQEVAVALANHIANPAARVPEPTRKEEPK
jgi:hypothetical protein